MLLINIRYRQLAIVQHLSHNVPLFMHHRFIRSTGGHAALVILCMENRQVSKYNHKSSEAELRQIRHGSISQARLLNIKLLLCQSQLYTY